MIKQLEDLVRFYAQKHHAPIALHTESWQLDGWDRNGVVVAMPQGAIPSLSLGDSVFALDSDFGKSLSGDLIVIEEQPVARIGKQWLIFLVWPKNAPAVALVRKLIDQHLPRVCRQYRHEQRGALVESIASCVHDRKRELQSSIREDSYELERLSLQMMQLSRKLETDRAVLRMFEKAPKWIKARSTRTFVDLMKLVPAVYASFRIEEDSVTGTTHPIDIEHDGYTYHFDAYEVEVNLRQGKVLISGGTNANGYVHPHVTDESSNICWGNIGHLVSRLAGELDLFGLFQLVHQFLTTYNENDPYQKIEKWDPDYEEPSDEEEPYCSWCDDYGHDIADCDSCWWCENCQQYDDHDEENCPNRPKEETEEEAADAVAEQAA